ncbi:DUF7948 domain-containing protein [Fibrella forsythiae]|uniref:Gliding motility-associated C-terminal domain-containing protein n=1 Tax=Fibrella forsythiae TaxID=2817061 RepID=A0ABS3JGB4_9BACT|nr:gliding motility-associated C-terminal domain-containing protein [Fibrella forsythiae]MBO0949027.1 gliding motility-associated C-terminal domain-containing protein [Fibrella forsythiae]
MRFVLTSILLFLTYLTCSAVPGGFAPGVDSPGDSTPGIVFVENNGQWAGDILFRADLPGGFLFLKRSGLHYVFYDTRETARRHTAPTATDPISPSIRAHGVSVSLLNRTGTGRVDGINPVGTSFSYFTGNDPSRWAGGVRGFPEVIYHDVYPGIHLRIYAYYQTLKYEFVVQPGADPARIQLAYAGADQLSLTDNRLIIKTSVNEFRENAPYSFVTQAEKATEVPTRWILDGPVARFDFPKGYDKTQALTIDPELVFTTFSGSRADNFGHTATYDQEGNTYAAGSVWGSGFPATTGAFQVDYAGQTDVGIMKFSPDGSRLLYAVNLGGSGADLPHSAVVNSKGELIIMGSTASPTFPTTAGAFQRGLTSVRGGGTSVYGGYLDYTLASDLFISRLATDGKSLIGSTLLGGSDNDGLNLYVPPQAQLSAYVRNYSDEFRGEVIVGPTDDVYVASTSLSADFPVTDGSKLNGFSDGVVCRLSADLTQLRWASRIAGNSVDEAHGLRLSPDGTLYVCGSSYSTNLGTAGSFQPQLAGLNDGYLARLTEGKITALTYLGTSFSDVADLVDIGPDNSPHVLGLTRGLYPVSANVYTNARSGQFIHALSPDLSKTVFSTVIGTGRALQANGSITGPDIAPTAFLVNACGNIYLAGWGGTVNQRNGYNAFSTTAGLPVTPDAYQPVTSASNFWIGVLERGAKSLLYGTFMGDTRTAADAVSDGDHVDGGTCRFDKDGTIYHAACSCRTNLFPATATAWSKTRGNTSCNNIAFKFDTDKLKATFDTYLGTKKNVTEGCAPLTLTFQNTSIGGRRYEWQIVGKVQSTNALATVYTFDKPGEYIVRLRAYNPLNCKLVDSTQQVIRVNPADFRVSKDTALCADRPVSLTAQGGVTYLWSPAAGLANPTSASILVAAKASTTYSVSITNEYGCSVNRTVTVSADNSFKPNISVEATPDCGKPTRLTFINSTVGANQFLWVMGDGDTLRTRVPENYRYPRSGTYEITVTAMKNDCAISLKYPIIYEDFSQIPNMITANEDGKNDVFDVGFPGAKLDIYNRWGKLLFQSSNYANDWGRKVAHGTYFYLLITPGGSQCKGWIEVLE